MAGLSSFSEEERVLILSVPYRVGIWISMSDDNDKTKADDKREMQVLETAISSLAARSKKMPFAALVMDGLKTHKGMWSSWEEHSGEDVVLQDVKKVLSLSQKKISKGELSQYKYAIWQIGIVVAQAFGEHLDPDNEMHVNNFFSWMGSFMGKPSLSKNPENMSTAEKIALKKLRVVLKG